MQISVPMTSESVGVRKKSSVAKAAEKTRAAKTAARSKPSRAVSKNAHSVVEDRRKKVAAGRKSKTESAESIQRKIDQLTHDRQVISAEIKELRVQLRAARAKTSVRK